MAHYLDSFSPENLWSYDVFVSYFIVQEDGSQKIETERLSLDGDRGLSNEEIEDLICQELSTKEFQVTSSDLLDWKRL